MYGKAKDLENYKHNYYQATEDTVRPVVCAIED